MKASEIIKPKMRSMLLAATRTRRRLFPKHLWRARMQAYSERAKRTNKPQMKAWCCSKKE